MQQCDNALPYRKPFAKNVHIHTVLHVEALVHRNNNPWRTTLKSPGWEARNVATDANKIRITLILAHARLKGGRATIGENVAFTFFPVDARPLLLAVRRH